MREIRKLRSRERTGRKKRRWWLGMLVLLLSVFGVWGGLAVSKKLSPDPGMSPAPGMIYLTEKNRPAYVPPPVPAVETQELSPSQSERESGRKPVTEENEKEDRFTFYKTLPTKKDQITPLTPEKKKGKETTPIVIPPLPSEKGEDPSRADKSMNPAAGFTIQVAALRDRRNADELAAALKGKGHAGYVVPLSSVERGTLYRVRVGHYPSRTDAQKAADRLSREGLNTFILKED